MNETAFDPLVAVMVHESVICSRDPSCPRARIEALIRKIIDQSGKAPDAERELTDLIGTAITVTKLKQILDADDTPLPPAQETFFSSSKALPWTARKKARAWTELEDIRLLAAIHKLGLESWGSVADFVGSGRSRSQCSQRWFRGLDPRISKVVCSPEEDEKLMELVEEFGDHSWTKIASILGNRSDAQCRYRYNHLAKETHVGEFRASGLGPVMSVPERVLMHELRVNATKSMAIVPKRVQLPPIADLLATVELKL